MSNKEFMTSFCTNKTRTFGSREGPLGVPPPPGPACVALTDQGIILLLTPQFYLHRNRRGAQSLAVALCICVNHRNNTNTIGEKKAVFHLIAASRKHAGPRRTMHSPAWRWPMLTSQSWSSSGTKPIEQITIQATLVIPHLHKQN